MNVQGPINTMFVFTSQDRETWLVIIGKSGHASRVESEAKVSSFSVLHALR